MNTTTKTQTATTTTTTATLAVRTQVRAGRRFYNHSETACTGLQCWSPRKGMAA